MSITTVRGTAVDCHMCKATRQFMNEADAHAYAEGHAFGHRVPDPVRPIVINTPAQPRMYKTGLNHTPHIILDLLTCGGWLIVHIPLALLAGRKTRVR